MAPSAVEVPTGDVPVNKGAHSNGDIPTVKGQDVFTAIKNPPESIFEPMIHPRADETAKEVDGFFLEHWPFPDDAARQKFLDAGFSRVTCLYFPKAHDDRIHFACRLLTILFLIDDLLEEMSFDEGSAYNENLIPIARGDVLPDRNIAAEWIFYDLWESMRACDKQLADEILEPTFVFMRAQTDKTRGTQMELGAYLRYREADVGKALLAALMRFGMELRMTPEQLASVKDIDENSAKHLSVINDIWSWEKEVLASKTLHEEGAALCSAVQVLAAETYLSDEAAKRVLTQMCREWELYHEELKATKSKTGVISSYIAGIEYQMGGNELWSRTTLRYIGVQ